MAWFGRLWKGVVMLDPIFAQQILAQHVVMRYPTVMTIIVTFPLYTILQLRIRIVFRNRNISMIENFFDYIAIAIDDPWLIINTTDIDKFTGFPVLVCSLLFRY